MKTYKTGAYVLAMYNQSTMFIYIHMFVHLYV